MVSFRQLIISNYLFSFEKCYQVYSPPGVLATAFGLGKGWDFGHRPMHRDRNCFLFSWRDFPKFSKRPGVFTFRPIVESFCRTTFPKAGRFAAMDENRAIWSVNEEERHSTANGSDAPPNVIRHPFPERKFGTIQGLSSYDLISRALTTLASVTTSSGCFPIYSASLTRSRAFSARLPPISQAFSNRRRSFRVMPPE